MLTTKSLQRLQRSETPSYLSLCDPSVRVFPLDWKVAYYRRNGGPDNGYVCPECKKTFFGSQGFDELHGDHVVSVKNGGETTWDNLQLLCAPCNLSKGSR